MEREVVFIVGLVFAAIFFMLSIRNMYTYLLLFAIDLGFFARASFMPRSVLGVAGLKQ